MLIDELKEILQDLNEEFLNIFLKFSKTSARSNVSFWRYKS